MNERRRPAEDLGDMPAEEFRRAAQKTAGIVADYLEGLERYPVLPRLSPGEIRAQLPAAAPQEGEPIDDILDDYRRLIEPNITHWQHPGFMAYFPCTASGPGILGEWLAAGLNSNVMFWKNAPASTELEETVVSWLRQMLALPESFDGMLTDTASISSMLALVAARHAMQDLDVRDRGLAGRPELPRLSIYLSDQAHMSIEKAAIVTGLGLEAVRKIPSDDRYRMRADLLRSRIDEDRARGWRPLCVIATLGTTSCTSMDPVDAIAEIAEREKLWLHVDAAYAGVAAADPQRRAWFRGWERADSIVFNPHKWLFTPFDASLLLFRRPELFRDAFSLVPEYLRGSQVEGAHNFSEYGIQLGRRFRALKLWMLLRWFGVDGIVRRIREHCRLADEFAGWVDEASDWERLAEVPFSTVCFRYRPDDEDDESRLAEWNRRILETVNREGEFYLSHTELRGRFTLRVSLGNPRAEMRHVRGCWTALNDAAGRLGVA